LSSADGFGADDDDALCCAETKDWGVDEALLSIVAAAGFEVPFVRAGAVSDDFFDFEKSPMFVLLSCVSPDEVVSQDPHSLDNFCRRVEMS